MKKAIKLFSAVALAALITLPACTSEPGNKPGGEGVTPGETGYLSLGLKTDLGSNLGGTRGYTDVAEGEDQERLVDALYILLYDSDDKLAQRIEVKATNNNGSGDLINFDGDDVSDETAATLKLFQTKGYPVTAGDYKMIVMANPTAKMLTSTDPDGSPLTLTAFKAVTDDVATSIAQNSTTIDDDVRFPMINSRGEITVDIDDLKPTKTAAEENPVTVGLDRMIAKVQVMKSSAFDANMAQLITNGKIKDYRNVTWDLDVMNNLSYWMREKTKNKSGADETGTDARQDLYAKDPNMAEITDGTYSQNFTAATINTAWVTGNTNAKEVKAADESNVVYALENTLNADVQATGKWETQATSVLVKVQIIPNNHSIGKTDWDTGYYSIDGFVFTQAEAVEWVNENSNIPSGVPTAFTLANLKANELFWKTGAAVTTAPTDYTISTLGTTPLVFHYKSWNVYRIPIRHFDFDTDGQTTFGHFGVVRNNWYRVSINKISGPGDGTSEKFISAKIDILDWVRRDQTEEL